MVFSFTPYKYLGFLQPSNRNNYTNKLFDNHFLLYVSLLSLHLFNCLYLNFPRASCTVPGFTT